MRRWRYSFRNWWGELSGVHRATFLLQILGIVVVAVYTLVAYGQWRQMIKATYAAKASADAAKSAAVIAANSLRQSVKQFKIDERPYLIAEYVRLATAPANGQKLAGEVLWRNTGRTPAIEVHSYLKIEVLDSEPSNSEEWVAFAENQKPTLEIGSSLVRSVPVVGNNALNEVARISTGRYHVYIFGAVAYTSTFDQGRVYSSRVCGRYEPRSVNELYLWACGDKETHEIR